VLLLLQVLTEFEDGCEVEQVQLSGDHMAVLLRQRCQFRLLAFKLHQSGTEASCQVPNALLIVEPHHVCCMASSTA
jgi:hypothetical protein